MHLGNDLSLEPRAWLIRPVFAKEHSKVLWPMLHRPLAAIHEIRFRPRLAIDRPRRNHRNRTASLRRIAGPRVHNMGVNLTLRPEKLLVTSGRRHRRVLQEDLRQRLTVIPGVLDLHRPAFRLIGRRPHTIHTASGPGDQSYYYAVPSQNVHHAIDRVAFADPTGV